MLEKLTELIQFSSEGFSLDFKREQYPIISHAKKHEILKDISAMANHPSNEDKFIIIGVKDENGVANEFFNIDSLIDDSTYQQLLQSSIEPHINFEYKSFLFNGFNLAYFRIYDNFDRPYLFKKDIQNSLITNKNEFKIGDGYIRIGSSTKKMSRSNFDNIYSNKFKNIDRKDHISVEPYLKNNSTTNWDIDVIDFAITNLSTKSIDFDIEVKIKKTSEFEIIEKTDFDYEIKLETYKKKPKGTFAILVSPIPVKDFNLHIIVEKFDDFWIVKRNRINSPKGAVNIPQNYCENSVLLNSIFVLGNPKTVDVEVTLRSDDFIEGFFVKSYTIENIG